MAILTGQLQRRRGLWHSPFLGLYIKGLPYKLFVLLARSFEYTRTPCESFLGACACGLAYSNPSHAPSGASLHSRAVVSCLRCCSYTQVKCTRSVGVVFLCSFVHPIFRPIPTTYSTTKSRCRPLLRIDGEYISRGTLAAVMNLFQVTTALR